MYKRQDHPSYRTLGRIRRFQREHGSAQTQGRWAYTKRLNTELGKDVYKRQLLQGIEAVANKQGYGVFICNTQRDPRLEEKYLRMMGTICLLYTSWI